MGRCFEIPNLTNIVPILKGSCIIVHPCTWRRFCNISVYNQRNYNVKCLFGKGEYEAKRDSNTDDVPNKISTVSLVILISYYYLE